MRTPDAAPATAPRAAAREGRRPPVRAPQLATLVAEAPDGDGWIHETRFNGSRCLAALGRGGTRLWTRNGLDWADRFGGLREAFASLPCDAALIDGAVMARDVNGSAFSALQRALKSGGPLVVFVFDLLSRDGAAADGPGAGTDPAALRGIRITHPARRVFPGAGVTKGDLARSYDLAGDRLLAIAGPRPLSLLRLPQGLDGERFFRKHAGAGFPDRIGRVEIEAGDSGRATSLQATRPDAFVAAAQMGTVAFHVWGARTDRLERPDRLILDLDPDEGLGWPEIPSAATDLRDRLAALGHGSPRQGTDGGGTSSAGAGEDRSGRDPLRPPTVRCGLRDDTGPRRRARPPRAPAPSFSASGP